MPGCSAPARFHRVQLRSAASALRLGTAAGRRGPVVRRGMQRHESPAPAWLPRSMRQPHRCWRRSNLRSGFAYPAVAEPNCACGSSGSPGCGGGAWMAEHARWGSAGKGAFKLLSPPVRSFGVRRSIGHTSLLTFVRSPPPAPSAERPGRAGARRTGWLPAPPPRRWR